MALGCGMIHHWMVGVATLAFLWVAPKKWLLLGVMAFMCGYALWRVPGVAPSCQEGVFYPKSAKPTQLPFKSAMVVTGTFEGFPCSMILNRNAKLHLDGAYKVQGSLKGSYFKPKKKAVWEKVPGTFSFAGIRYRCKQRMQKYVLRYYKPRDTADFIAAISTGELENRKVRFFFSRLGLQHILAISGFHFALIALIVGWALRCLLPLKWASGSLLALLSLYAFVLGDTPSVMRSFFMIGLYLVSILVDRKSHSLNLLGAALMLELLYDPNHVIKLGFLLSYCATLGIFLLNGYTKRWIDLLLPERTKEQLEHFPRVDAYGYLVGSYIRGALSLNLAVCLPLLPILLACFGTFPLLGLLYNLFIPLLVTGVLTLFLIGTILPPVHALNGIYSTWVLELTRYPPQPWLISLRMHVPVWLAIGATSMLFVMALRTLLLNQERQLRF